MDEEEEFESALDYEDAELSLEDRVGAELEKGSASSVPQDYLAMTSFVNDLASSGGQLTREKVNQAIGDRSNEIAARKADIYKRIASNQGLSNSQLVALGVLALGLVAAGGAARGKRGIAAAGDAIKLGGGVLLASDKAKDDAQTRADAAELKSLNSEESRLGAIGMKNLMAPIEREERIGEYVDKKKRAKAAGVGSGSEIGELARGLAGLFTKDIPGAASSKAANVNGILENSRTLMENLGKVPSETLVDRGKWQISKQFSATDAGKIDSQAKLLARLIVNATDRGAPSDFDIKSWESILNGDWTGSAADMKQLVAQSTGMIARAAAAQLEAEIGLRDDPMKVINGYKQAATTLLGESGKTPGKEDSLFNFEGKTGTGGGTEKRPAGAVRKGRARSGGKSYDVWLDAENKPLGYVK